MYSVSMMDRERAPRILVGPCPFTYRSRDTAIERGLEYLQTYCGDDFDVTMVRCALEDAFHSKKVGWVSAPEDHVHAGSIKVAMYVGPLHDPDE